MTSLRLDKLQLFWDYFIHAQPQSCERSSWLDLFLAEFLIQVNGGANINDIRQFCSMNRATDGSISRLIACELLSDINELCAAKNEADQLIELYKYLVEGRGWRSLAVLHMLGEHCLSCGRKLFTLLIALYPISYHTFSDENSTETPPQNPYIRNLNLTNDMININDIICRIKNQNYRRIKNSNTYLNKTQREGARRKAKKLSTNVIGNRMTRFIKQTNNNNSSTKEKFEAENKLSSESDVTTEDQEDPPRFSSIKIQFNPMDFDYFTSVVRSDEEKSVELNTSHRSIGYKKPDDFIDNQITQVLNSRVNNFETSLLILKLLQNVKDQDSPLDQTFSIKIYKFSLDTLWSLQFNTDALNLSVNQCVMLKSVAVRLMLIALEQVLRTDEATTAVIHNGFIPMTLRLLEDVCGKPMLVLSPDEGKLFQEFIFALVYEVIIFFHHHLQQRKSIDKIRNFFELFQLFIECQDGKLLYNVVAMIVDVPSNDLTQNWIKKIIDLLGILISDFKSIKFENSNKLKTNKSSSSSSSTSTSVVYHHNYALGCAYSQALVADVSQPICYISSTFKILLKLLDQSAKLRSDIQVRLVKIMTQYGTCCCFSPEMLLTSIINYIKKHQNNKKIYTVCAILLENCLFEKIGASGWKTFDCSVCGHLIYSWDYLEAYRTLLSVDNSQLCYVIMAHLLKITSYPNVHMKQSMVFKVFYPTFLTMKKINNNQVKIINNSNSNNNNNNNLQMNNTEFIIHSCLSIFSSVIIYNQWYEKFKEINGLQEVLQLFSNIKFTRTVCNLLQVSVIMEIWKIIKTDKSDDVNNDVDIFDNSIIKILFEIIKEKTNNLYSVLLSMKSMKLNGSNSSLINEQKDCELNDNLCKIDKTEFKELENSKISFDELLLKNLFQASAVWKAAAGVILYCPKFRTGMTNNTIALKALDLLKVLVVFIVEDSILDKNKHAYKLIEALLTCCLAWSISTCDVISELRSTLINNKIHFGRGTAVFVEALLRSAMIKLCQEQTALQPSRPRIPTMISNNLLSDYCEDDSSAEEYLTADDGYEADIENRGKPAKENFTKNVNALPMIVESHDYVTADPALFSLAIDLLIHFHDRASHDDKNSIVIQGLRNIAIICKDNTITCATLARSGIIIKLLTGYKSILVDKNPSYQDLQHAVLELFTLLTLQSISSEELLFYLSLFKTDCPPLQMLLQPLYRLITNLQPQPNYILSFPITAQLIVNSENDKSMEQVSNIVSYFKRKHVASQICSPWSIHALVLPIGPEVSWSIWLHGCSVSLWIRIERGFLATSRATPFNNSQKLFNSQSDSFSDWKILSDDWSRKVCASSASPPCPTAIVHFLSIGFESLVLETWFDLQSDKMILRLTRPDDKTNRTISEASVTGILPSGRWHHLAMNIKDTILNRKSAVVEVVIWIDGWHQVNVHLPFDGLLIRKSGNSCVMLGQIGPNSNGAWYLGNLMLFRSPIFTKERALYLTSLGPNYTNLADCILNPAKPDFAYLIAVGALSGVKKTKLEHGKFDLHRRKSYGGTYLSKVVETKIIRTDINWTELMDDSNSHLNELQDNILLCYEARCPKIAHLYPQPISNPTAAVRNILPTHSGFRVVAEHKICQQPPLSISIITPYTLECQQYQGFISSASLIGGVPVFLFLFGRIVELNSSEEEQARALSIVINFIRKDSELMSQFNLEGGYSLIMSIIESSRCHAGIQMLKAILDCACDNSVIVNDIANGNYTILQSCEAVVMYPELIKESLTVWRTWVKFDTLNTFLLAVFTLLRDQHTQREFNANQLNRVDLVETILLICKEHFICEDSTILWDSTTANIIVELVRSLMGAPPEFSHLVAIMDYLILVHRVSDTFITHSRHNMYFILPSVMQESKSNKGMSKQSNMFRGTSSSDESLGINETSKLDKGLINKQLKKGDIPEMQGNDSNIDESNINNDSSFLSSSSRINKSNDDNNHMLENSAGEDSGIAASDGSNSKKKFGTFDLADDKRACQGLVTEGLLLLLRDALRVLPDCQVESVIKHVIRAELLLVIANNPDTRVRTAVIKVLQAYIHRVSDEEVNKFIKQKYFYHLSNQISIYPGSEALASAIEVLAIKGPILAATPPLLAILTKSPVNTGRQIVMFITETINKIPNMVRVLFEQGLVEASVQALVSGAHKNNSTSFFNDVYILLVTVVTKLLEMPGNNNMPMILDLHSILSYVELNERSQCRMNSNCVSVVRTAQIVLFDSELDALMPKVSLQTGFKLRSTASYIASTSYMNNVLTTSSEQSDHGSQASSYNSLYDFKELGKNEINQRFRIILFKAIEFITVFDYPPANNELELSKKLFVILLYGLSSDLDRKNNWIGTWSHRQSFKKNAIKIMIWMLSMHQSTSTRIFVIRSFMEELKGREILALLLDSEPQVELKMMVLIKDLLDKKGMMPSSDAQICMEFKEALMIWQLMKELDSAISDLREKELIQLQQDVARNKETFIKNNSSTIQRIGNKFNILAEQLTENAMTITRYVIEEQNRERKALMKKLKDVRVMRAQTMAKWRDIIRRMTHERGPWYFPKSFPQSWELDPTEGPARVRIRMKRCHLTIDKRFFLPEYQHTVDSENIESPLSYLFKTIKPDVNATELIEKLFTSESIHKMSQAKVVTPHTELPGEVLIGEICMYFIPDKPKFSLYTQDINLDDLDIVMAGGIVWKLQDIRELHSRRYELQDTALELFLTTGRTYLLTFNSSKERDEFVSQLLNSNLPRRVPGDDLGDALTAWRKGNITNWEYIMCLNKLAGRSYNDLMQYPVFPFVLADYLSESIDLNNYKIYRNFGKPMAVQDKKNEQHYINNYNYLKQARAEGVNQEPFHYGSHYSNSGTVLHFLVRLPPYTSMFLSYQDNNFDIPDRTFHSISTTWRLTSCDSTSDVKELIPEFFHLPEFLLNSVGFNFGLRQNGSRVGDVDLPSWCKGDARLFILVHRTILEADYVRENLPYWIDLVFGFRQTGKPAVEAINVFHPATYYGFDVDQITDPLVRSAWETMVRTCGQTPAQLFNTAHLLPIMNATNSAAYNNIPPVIENVSGIKWGNYVGAPGNEPVLCWKHRYRVPVASLIPLVTGDVFGLPIFTVLLIGYNNQKGINMSSNMSVSGSALISWNNNDGIIRLKSKKEQPPKPLIRSSGLDPITIVASAPDCDQLWFGHQSGKIMVYSYNIISMGKIDVKRAPASILLAHKSPVTVIALSRAFSVAVSGDVNGIVVIWDLNSLVYVRSIVIGPNNPIERISISNTLGDIAIVSNATISQEDGSNSDHKSQLKVFTINAKLVGTVLSRRKITAVCYSNAPEGVSVNVIATGLDNGVIRLWSSWDLRLIREIMNTGKDCGAIISITWSQDQHYLYAATDESTVIIWEGMRRLISDTPKFFNLTSL